MNDSELFDGSIISSSNKIIMKMIEWFWFGIISTFENNYFYNNFWWLILMIKVVRKDFQVSLDEITRKLHRIWINFKIEFKLIFKCLQLEH